LVFCFLLFCLGSLEGRSFSCVRLLGRRLEALFRDLIFETLRWFGPNSSVIYIRNGDKRATGRNRHIVEYYKGTQTSAWLQTGSCWVRSTLWKQKDCEDYIEVHISAQSKHPHLFMTLDPELNQLDYDKRRYL